jgi:hypothetical protein
MMLNIRKIIIVMAIATLVSCNDFLDVESFHNASESEQWNTLEDTRGALSGIYGLMRAALAENDSHWLYGDLRMGDFTVTSRRDLECVKNNDLLYPLPLLEALSDWNRFYRVINAASVFIERAPQVVTNDKSYSEQNLIYDVAQARALRAFAYFYMVRLWGDVPLITQSYDNGSFPDVERSDATATLNYVKNELMDVVDDLPVLYGTSGNLYYRNNSSYWRGVLFNKVSVFVLLAHIAAWEERYSDADAFAKAAIEIRTQQGAQYVTVTDLTASNGYFSSGNSTWAPSRLLAFPFLNGQSESTQSGHIENLTLAYPLTARSKPDIYISKDSLLAIFGLTGDLRFGIDKDNSYGYYSTYVNEPNSDKPLFSKIKVVRDGAAANNNYGIFGSAIVFSRLEELTLLRAEALVAQNKHEEALIQYNTIRLSRNLSVASYKLDFKNDPVKLLRAIFEERRKELIGEGWQWYDMIRRERLLPGDNPTMRTLIQNGGIYLPVSQSVLRNNPKIKQNKYWEENNF